MCTSGAQTSVQWFMSSGHLFPMLATTATVTNISLPTIIRLLNIVDYKLICVPPKQSNIYLEVRVRTTIEEDLASFV